MHHIQADIGIPKIKTTRISDTHAIFTVTPLPPGYGVTVGNAFRRVLLSSLPGAAITQVKIEGVTHEYSTLKGVRESMLDIILNLRTLNIKKASKEPSIITLNVHKEGVVTAKDIKVSGDTEILNQDLYITTLDKSGKLSLEMKVEKGVGFSPASVRQKEDTEANVILVDAIFSPVRKVRYEVESTRVGQMTNLDKLTLEVMTNGSITPEDAIKFASNLLQSYFNLFNHENIMVEKDFMSDFSAVSAPPTAEEGSKPANSAYTPIEILGLSPRTLNALINGSIGSVEQLVQCTETHLSNLRGFGKKALDEVDLALKAKGFKLADSVGLPSSNQEKTSLPTE